MRFSFVAVTAAFVAGSAFADEVVPPEIRTRVEAVLPVNAPAPTQDHVLLEFSIHPDGRVSDVAVIESAGTPWDNAAKTAILQWTFRPAYHQGQPVLSRTRLPFYMPMPDAGVVGLAGDAGSAPVAELDAGVEPDAGVAVAAGPDAGVLDEEDDDPLHPKHELSTTVTGRGIPRSRGGADFHFELDNLKLVPRGNANAAKMLELAPGMLLTNEGGELHAERIFLRGFDAREGQDLELSADGVPINDSGNIHGNGFADLHFLIPELVEGIRVIEGPFDPRQGNYAVAGSADYELGLSQRGVTGKLAVGSFDSQRLVVLFRPPSKGPRTYAGVQLFKTSGFGQNRDARSGTVMLQYEGDIGEEASFRVAATGYIGNFHSAGVLRDDDFREGRIGFFDTYDRRQGGDSARGSLSFDVTSHGGPFVQHHQVFAVYRSSRLRENYTGYLFDTQETFQTPHGQRGDLIDRSATLGTFGARGGGRWRQMLFGHPQDLEVGYFARLDLTSGQSSRVQADSEVPYKTEADLEAKLGDIGLYADLNFHPLDWLTLRGGLRADLFTWDVLDKCAVQDVRRPSEATRDQSCLSQQQLGQHREPYQRMSTSAAVVMPRATLLLGPWAGATVTASYGEGVRSIDPIFVTQDVRTPFASIRAGEGGIEWKGLFDDVMELGAKGTVFGTRVDQDLFFSEQAGRNVIGGGTTRIGGLLQARAKGSFFDVAAHGTYVKSTFDDTGLLVPYVPDLVLRLDAAAFHALPWQVWHSPIDVRGGLGMTYVGRRALPLGQRSDVIFTTDLSLEVAWKHFTLNGQVQNLFGAQYRLAEYNYASNFGTGGPLPTLVPTRHFSAGAPRTFWLTLGVNVGGP